MNGGKGKSKPTLGDAAPDFLAQWQASKPEMSQGGAGAQVDQAISYEGTLRSWKRGGTEVKVTKGTSKGLEMRKKERGTRGPGNTVVARGAGSGGTMSASPLPDPSESVPAVESLRQRLAKASADLNHLPISSAVSRPSRFTQLAPVMEDESGRLAILGLDFGTAFTKAVVRWSRRHYAVDWSAAVTGKDCCLLASVFSESPDGLCILGECEVPGWSVREGIKLRLLSIASTGVEGTPADAVIFVALAFRYVAGWLGRVDQDAQHGVRWRLHVGLPTKSWDSDATTDLFKNVAQAARVLACMHGPVTRAAAVEALRMADHVERPAVDVFPEFACQLYSYLQSPERSQDLHALVDIGAGTLDVAYFNVFVNDNEALLPIFAAEVDLLGVHYLIAALAGPDGDTNWADGDSSISDEDAGRKLNCPSSDVQKRRSLYLSCVADVFNQTTQKAKRAYQTSPAFHLDRPESVRLFLCGGGSRIPSLRERFFRIAEEARSRYRISFQVTELITPKDIVGRVESGFDRLSVAYGLSQLAGNIGGVMRSASLDPIAQRERIAERDRDDDR